jgi:hypothetical protein
MIAAIRAHGSASWNMRRMWALPANCTGSTARKLGRNAPSDMLLRARLGVEQPRGRAEINQSYPICKDEEFPNQNNRRLGRQDSNIRISESAAPGPRQPVCGSPSVKHRATYEHMIPLAVPIAFAVLALVAWRYDERARRAYEATLSEAEKRQFHYSAFT